MTGKYRFSKPFSGENLTEIRKAEMATRWTGIHKGKEIPEYLGHTVSWRTNFLLACPCYNCFPFLAIGPLSERQSLLPPLSKRTVLGHHQPD